MIRRPPRSTRTDARWPYTPRFLARGAGDVPRFFPSLNVARVVHDLAAELDVAGATADMAQVFKGLFRHTSDQRRFAGINRVRVVWVIQRCLHHFRHGAGVMEGTVANKKCGT